MKILYTSNDVHSAIKKIFVQSKNKSMRRIAIVAYLGVNADKFLPSPKGLEIICNPEPGATDPTSIRSLIAQGAKIKFSDKLHSKVYWSKIGCIITSANISHRALGSSNQKETGILIDSKEFDIDRLLEYVKPYKITQPAMDKLAISDRAIRHAVGVKSNLHSKKDYMSWFLSAYREPWKIGCWYENFAHSKAAIEKSKDEYNVKVPYGALAVTKNQVKNHEWLLCFKITDKGLTNFEWMYVDFVVSVSRKDKTYDKNSPFDAVQVRSLKYYSVPPFLITKEFRQAFNGAAKKYGIERIENSPSLNANKVLLKYVADFLKNQ